MRWPSCWTREYFVHELSLRERFWGMISKLYHSVPFINHPIPLLPSTTLILVKASYYWISVTGSHSETIKILHPMSHSLSDSKIQAPWQKICLSDMKKRCMLIGPKMLVPFHKGIWTSLSSLEIQIPSLSKWTLIHRYKLLSQRNEPILELTSLDQNVLQA